MNYWYFTGQPCEVCSNGIPLQTVSVSVLNISLQHSIQGMYHGILMCLGYFSCLFKCHIGALMWPNSTLTKLVSVTTRLLYTKYVKLWYVSVHFATCSDCACCRQTILSLGKRMYTIKHHKSKPLATAFMCLTYHCNGCI